MKVYKRLALILIAVLMCTCYFSNAVLAANGDQITLGAWDRTESLAFQMTNMVPGDTEMKEYAVTISDKRAIAVRFDVEIRGTDDTLAEVLHIKVEKNDTVLYNGTLEKMPALTEKLTGKLPQTLNYRITVSLDTSVGNEYMGKNLSADFNWSIEREPYTPTPPLETTTTAKPKPQETTSETTTTELTTEAVTTETTPIETTAQTEETTTATTPAETTSQTTSETTSLYEETTTEITPPVIGEPCCECCVGYGFPYSCNFGSFREDDIGCDLPWCCASENGCWCPWCWIIPLIILIILIIVVIIIIRKLTKKKEEEKEEKEGEEEATTDE